MEFGKLELWSPNVISQPEQRTLGALGSNNDLGRKGSLGVGLFSVMPLQFSFSRGETYIQIPLSLAE